MSSDEPVFEPVPQQVDFPATEREILQFWKDERVFERSMEQRRGQPTFVFYEGPPTANGTPHNGHVLTRVIKDLFPRFKTMRGYHVPRKAGWDTHGLPVEVEVEKELGIHGKEAIEAYGLEAFTRKCLESVFRYVDVWHEQTEQLGFWIDLDDPYVTYHRSYVESIWWALSKLFERGLLYKGHKIVWWWPQGGTALSAAEVGLGYKTVDDPSIVVRFPVEGDREGDQPGSSTGESPLVPKGTSFLGWTTTPWTLPSNCALAVHPEMTYLRVVQEGEGGSERLLVAEELADDVLGEGAYEVEARLSGRDLVGLRYETPFPFATPERGRYREVVEADFVTAEAGTGIVHVAPAFGEDDFRLAHEQGLGILQLVRPDGTFDERVEGFAGRFCKDADRDLIRDLRRRGLLYKEEIYRHDYPFCWRADEDPLIQYARPTWFVHTTREIERAKANNQTIQWIPEHIRDGRFGDFLEHNVDWALSRERYWGTPLNIWSCGACGAQEAPSSVAAIRERNPEAFAHFERQQREDPHLSEHLMVHKPWIDRVTFPCASCGGEMERAPEVIDCWFDSGCMPFAQWGWPHRGEDMFDAAFPADFISEAVDQTRGWFYSLLMVSTLLFEEATPPHPYRTCIVLGHVCDRHGRKESKSKGNYTPPERILENDGADAMRWYFYAANPPWNNTRFSPEAVREAHQDFLVKIRNVYAFFVIYANIDGFDPSVRGGEAPSGSPERAPARPVGERRLLDRWVLSELNLAQRDVTEHMEHYRVYEAAQRLIRLVDAVSNWYVRRSRPRFWSSAEGAGAEKWDAYHTLYEVLITLTKMAAPFVPFYTERMYRNLVRRPQPNAPDSVHLTDWPALDEAAVDERLSEDMQQVRELVSLGLATRTSHKIRVRQPLRRAEIILARPELTERVRAYEGLIAEELNVHEIQFTQEAGGRVSFRVKPNYRALGPRFGKRMPLVRNALDQADGEAVRRALAEDGVYRVELEDGETVELSTEDVQVNVEALEGWAASGGRVGVVVLDTRLDDDLRIEGLAREVTNRIQTVRKELDLPYTARIGVHVAGGERLREAAERHRDDLARETLASRLEVVEALPEGGTQRTFSLDDEELTLRVEIEDEAAS